MIKIALKLFFFLRILTILDLSLCLADLPIEDLVSSKDSVDVISKGDSPVMIFGSLLKHFHRNVPIELPLASIGIS